MLPQLFVAGTFRCKCKLGPSMLIWLLFFTPGSRRGLAGTAENCPATGRYHITARLHFKKKITEKSKKKKVLIACPAPKGPISYGLSLASTLFMRKPSKWNTTPHPSLKFPEEFTVQKSRGGVFPGLVPPFVNLWSKIRLSHLCQWAFRSLWPRSRLYLWPRARERTHGRWLCFPVPLLRL